MTEYLLPILESYINWRPYYKIQINTLRMKVQNQHKFLYNVAEICSLFSNSCLTFIQWVHWALVHNQFHGFSHLTFCKHSIILFSDYDLRLQKCLHAFSKTEMRRAVIVMVWTETVCFSQYFFKDFFAIVLTPTVNRYLWIL